MPQSWWSLGLIILLVIFFLWRTTARVIRAQVLTLRTRPFVWAARAAGASELTILFRHIAPNVLPLSFLYVAIGVQAKMSRWTQALAFLTKRFKNIAAVIEPAKGLGLALFTSAILDSIMRS